MTILAGKYQLIGELGEGSTGKVFLVQHPDLNVKYALKVLHNTFSDNPLFVEQFKREAELLLRFTHEGCVQLRDFGRLESGSYFMATDYCEGETLKNRLKRGGALDTEHALNLLIQLLDVLSAAHARGIIHRDIKPDNIIIEAGYQGKEIIKVLDFGIAQLLELDRSKDDNNSEDYNEELTVGTPGYMSPEQAYGERDLDHRVDIYATAIIAYEMLTGVPPYSGDSPEEILLAHVTKLPDPFAARLGLPTILEKLVFKGMEKSRQKRFSSATAFKQELTNALSLLTETNALSRINVKLDTSQQDILIIHPDPVVKSSSSNEEKAQTNNQTGTVVSRILILDDEDTLLTLTSHILQLAGYEVFTASNVTETHRFLVHEQVDLLITDVQMPDMPGWKVCKMLKASLPNLRVILFSTLDSGMLAKLTLDSGADGWISKMTPPKQWLPLIKEVLSKPSGSLLRRRRE